MKTSAPPSIALALMAARLAGLRVRGDADYVFRPSGWCAVHPRSDLYPPVEMRGTREYYAIIDRINRGEQP